MSIGIALSGGALRGVFHLGVLKAFEGMSMRPDVLSGTSSGAIIAALYSDGKSTEEIMDIVREASLLKMLRPKIWKGGLMSLNYLKEILNKKLDAVEFEDLSIPLFITATNLSTGEVDVFSKGELVPIILASSSVPLLFEPIEIQNQYFTDGGLLMNLPAQPIRKEVDVLVGINLVPDISMDAAHLKGIGKVTSRIFDVSVLGNIKPQLSQCDLVITHPSLNEMGRFSFDNVQKLYDLGYEATMEQEDRIKELCQ